MQLIDGAPVFSATDLVGYLACEHLTALETAVLHGDLQRPIRDDRELDIIRKRGFAHEARYLEELRGLGLRVVTIERDDDEERGAQIRRQAADTVAAMASGADVIFQATFFDGRWLGYADFLLRIESPDRPSIWGPYHYEVADTKLARHVKAGAVLQICSYVEQLERIQGVRPERMKVVLGGSAHETAVLRVDDYLAYYRAAKARFEAAVLDEERLRPSSPSITYPEPVDHCGVCRWSIECAARRRRRTTTSRSWPGSPPPAYGAGHAGDRHRRPPGQRPDPVRSAARREQRGQRGAGPGAGTHPGHRSRPSEADIRAAPAGRRRADRAGARPRHAAPSPIRATCSSTSRETPTPSMTASTTCSAYSTPRAGSRPSGRSTPTAPGEVTLAGEKAGFERLMDLLIERLERHPGMHIYHYASYEPTALKRLMGRHATREDEVDRLLRGGDPGRPVPRCAAGAAGIRGELLDQADRADLRLRACDPAPAMPGRASSPSRSGSSSAKASGRPPRSSRRSPRTTATTSSSTAGFATGSRRFAASWRPRRGQTVPRPVPVSGDAPVDAGSSGGARGGGRGRAHRRRSGGRHRADARSAGALAARPAAAMASAREARRPTGSSSIAWSSTRPSSRSTRAPSGRSRSSNASASRTCRHARNSSARSGAIDIHRRTTTSARGASCTTPRCARPIPMPA